jgi:hypothetical protein
MSIRVSMRRDRQSQRDSGACSQEEHEVAFFTCQSVAGLDPIRIEQVAIGATSRFVSRARGPRGHAREARDGGGPASCAVTRFRPELLAA